MGGEQGCPLVSPLLLLSPAKENRRLKTESGTRVAVWFVACPAGSTTGDLRVTQPGIGQLTRQAMHDLKEEEISAP